MVLLQILAYSIYNLFEFLMQYVCVCALVLDGWIQILLGGNLESKKAEGPCGNIPIGRCDCSAA